MVLRGLQRGLVFFTDCESDKGAELAANPRAAAVLHWLVPAHRQVRVAGPVERVGEDEADQYWSTRAPAVRLSAAALHQSRVVASRAVLQTQVQDRLRRHPRGADVPRPRRWGGFRVLPSRVEFWQESPDGLHDRNPATAGEAAAGSSSGCRRNDPGSRRSLTAEGGHERRDVAANQLWLLGGATWPAPGIGRQQRMLYMCSAHSPGGSPSGPNMCGKATIRIRMSQLTVRMIGP